MNFWSVENIRALVGGTWIARPRGAAAEVDRLSIDSRAIRPGQVFLALKGERTDGHAYLAQAIGAGAALAIVDNPGAVEARLIGAEATIGVLKVEDSAQALIRLAAAYRRTLETTRVIAVAGSNGKTTTKGLIHTVLSTRLRGSASPKSFNNAIGVPLTILGAKRSDHFLVCEVGTNAPGEIAQLAAIIQPDIAVITSIGREHLELLGSLEGVAREEASLMASLKPGGAAIYNADAPLLHEAVQSIVASLAGASSVRFGASEDADLRLTRIEPTREGVSFLLNERSAYTIPLLGRHNAMNAAAAIAVARKLGVGEEDIRAGLAACRPAEMRLQRQRFGEIDVINDAYNANPDSMLAAIDVLVDAGAGASRRVAILGDMLEQGSGGPDVHREIGQALGRRTAIDLVVLVGPLMGFAAERLAKAWPAAKIVMQPSLDDASAGTVAGLLKPGDCVLLKGSRGMALERVLRALPPGNAAGQTPGRATQQV